MKNYQPILSGLWSGRASLTPSYWYQNVRTIDIRDTVIDNDSVVLIAYACDEGITRNQGGVGAQYGPDAIRKMMGSIAWHIGGAIKVYDAGNVNCVDHDLEQAQKDLSDVIYKILQSGSMPIAIGGGHDIALGHYRGIAKYLIENSPKSKIGIINFDAHFDLRAVVDSGNSGTPFNEISIEAYGKGQEFLYMCLGIQRAANTVELFNKAHELKVDYVMAESMIYSHIETIKARVRQFVSSCDQLYVTIDLDGFSSAFAPGVSAPSPMGFAPDMVLALLHDIIQSGKLLSLDIAELNPQYDVDHSTARLAARIIEYVVRTCME